MSERRRMMINNKAGLITDGLVVWYDGKNNLQGGGYSTSSSTWYPHYGENANVLACYLSKVNSPSWRVDGGLTMNNTSTYNGYKNSGYAFTYYANAINDFTWILHVNTNSTGFIVVGESFKSGGTGRYHFDFGVNTTRKFEFHQQNGSSWVSKYGGRTFTGTIKTVAFVRSGSTLYIYVNGELFDQISNVPTTPLISYIPNFLIVSYNAGDLGFVGDYYSAMCYRRALAEDEVKNMMEYLEYRQANIPVGSE